MVAVKCWNCIKQGLWKRWNALFCRFHIRSRSRWLRLTFQRWVPMPHSQSARAPVCSRALPPRFCPHLVIYQRTNKQAAWARARGGTRAVLLRTTPSSLASFSPTESCCSGGELAFRETPFTEARRCTNIPLEINTVHHSSQQTGSC